MVRPSMNFRPPRLGKGDGMMMAISVIFLVFFSGILTPMATGQLLLPNKQVICNFASCMNWCECTGERINLTTFSDDFLFSDCSLGEEFLDWGTCPDDPSKVVIAQRRDGNVKNCLHSRINPLIFFKNETNGTDYALRAWDSSQPDSYVLLSEFCAPQCNTKCGIVLPTTPTPLVPMTTPMSTGQMIDVLIPRYSPAPTGKPGTGLSPAEARILGIAVGASVAGLLICLIVVYFCYSRKRKNKNRGPKLPPRRNMGNNENRDYATIEEIQMTSTNSSPARRGGAYPNGLYRSESLSAISALNPDPTLHRSVSDIALLGDPPHPPVRQMSLLPGVNPALADGTDGHSAPQDADGYTKYLPEAESHALPYMHLKVSPTMSDPAAQNQAPLKPHRYRSNTADTHANAADVDRAIERIRARQALKDGSNRRFVPNQSGRGRSSTLGEDYNRLNKNGHRGVPRSRKNDSGAFTPVPVHGQYHSRPRRSPESVRRWRSLPDMTNGGQAPPTMPADSDENPPIYHLLERSPTSSLEDYSRRATYQPSDEPDGMVLRQSKVRDSRGSRRAASESGPSSYRSPSQGNTVDERYDPVYESRVPNKTRVPQSPNEYQPLSTTRPEYLEFDEHPGPDEALDSDAYLRPNGTPRSGKENGSINGGSCGTRSPNAPLNGHVCDHVPDSTAYIYGSDNNNLSMKKQPSRTVGGNTYAPLKLRQDGYDNLDDDMENGEYMYHPAGPDIMA